MMSDTSERPTETTDPQATGTPSSAAQRDSAYEAAEHSSTATPAADGMLHGSGTALGGGDLIERLRRRVSRDVLPSVRALADHAREVAETARPHVERAAEQAKAAAEAVLPRVEEAGRAALRYTREHEDDLKRASGRAAQTIARGVVPRPLRGAVDAFEEGLRESPAAPDQTADDGKTSSH